MNFELSSVSLSPNLRRLEVMRGNHILQTEYKQLIPKLTNSLLFHLILLCPVICVTTAYDETTGRTVPSLTTYHHVAVS
jgi:hypothetical protein